MLGADGCLVAVILIVALVVHNYNMLEPVIFGVLLMPLAARGIKRARQRVERAHRLNG
jgi:hypothetical protein